MPTAHERFFQRPHSIEEVAEYLGSTRDYIGRQIYSGKLRARKLSAKFVRIMPSDLIEWLDAAATKPIAAPHQTKHSRRP
jgi:excisionase family DNA binding protein